MTGSSSTTPRAVTADQEYERCHGGREVEEVAGKGGRRGSRVELEMLKLVVEGGEKMANFGTCPVELAQAGMSDAPCPRPGRVGARKSKEREVGKDGRIATDFKEEEGGEEAQVGREVEPSCTGVRPDSDVKGDE